MGTCATNERLAQSSKPKEWRIAQSGAQKRLTMSSEFKPSRQKQQQMRKKLSYEYFDQFDSNHDNLMSFKDVQSMLNHIYNKENTKPITKKLVKNFIKQVDTNNGGKIGKEEFYHFYNQMETNK